MRGASLTLLVFTSACGSAGGPAVRVLSSQAPSVRAEATPRAIENAPDLARPRIGAPGGSGAGSRRVVPVQSGNETVGFLPAGIGGGSGPRG